MAVFSFRVEIFWKQKQIKKKLPFPLFFCGLETGKHTLRDFLFEKKRRNDSDGPDDEECKKRMKNKQE